MAEIVEDGRSGLHFKPGDPVDLAEKVQWILADPLKLQRMRQAARETFDQHFTADANHKILMAIYERALNGHSGHETRG
jgi:glycosyltransferase involved in cell wall biosynthesis